MFTGHPTNDALPPRPTEGDGHHRPLSGSPGSAGSRIRWQKVTYTANAPGTPFRPPLWFPKPGRSGPAAATGLGASAATSSPRPSER